MKNTLLRFFSFLIFSIFIRDVHSKSYGLSSFSNLGIVGGKNTTIEKRPYQVVVMCPKMSFGCAGSIISPRFILTAGHCAQVCLQYSVVQVRAGSAYRKGGGTIYNALRINVHPNYNIELDFDVALIELERNITLDGKTTKAVTLPPLGTSAAIPAGTNITVSGWGMVKQDDLYHIPKLPNQLREVTISIVSNEDCNKYYGNANHTTPRMFCAGIPQGGKGVCKGDGGSPAVDSSTGVQLGLASFGTCAIPGYPDVFANLTNSDIRNWIWENTGV